MKPERNRTLVWLRRDLRLTDNAALAQAAGGSREFAVAFVFDTRILSELPDRDDRRITFIHRSLTETDRALRARGSMLVVRRGDPAREIPLLAAALGCDAVYANRDYEPYANHRDAEIASRLKAQGKGFLDFKDQVIFERDEILTGSGSPFKVFTPYKKAWLDAFHRAELEGPPPTAEHRASLDRLCARSLLESHSHTWSFADLGFRETEVWLDAGQAAARKRLTSFLKRIDSYHEQRDFPAAAATSGLSAHLRFGTISIRALVREAMRRQSEGTRVWLSELVWREFYMMILDRFPHVVDGAFRQEYDTIRWPGREEHFAAWCDGCTGYPLVDAAMRHFARTGWMHNRLRMVTAMFLTKDLLVDWRRGEAHFARHLLDYDLAANNGGWQWSASTGCDAQPYFRVFNPVLQSRKFDPGGAFIRANVPELRGFSDARLHWPHDADPAEQRAAGCVLGKDYPHPIVDHAVQREKAIALFRRIRGA